MNINEAMNFIHSTDWKGSVLGLDRTRELLSLLGNPQESLKFIHVAGTNGKGSTCSMLSSILTKAGYKTGLYTSPFITHFNERMRVNQQNIADHELVAIVEKIKPLISHMENSPTEFELITAVAMEHFKNKDCDLVVLEVGMGGRLDSTNVITAPLVSVITKISKDHIQMLGDTIAKIATEKAGIIKPNCPVVALAQDEEVMDIFTQTALANNSPITFTQPQKTILNSASLQGQNLNYKDRSNLEISLIGDFQLENVSLVLETIDVVAKNGFPVLEEDIYQGLKEARWAGRFEVLSNSPLFIADGAHNLDGVTAFASSLKKHIDNQKAIFIVGLMADKEYDEMLKIIYPLAKKIIAVTPAVPRALPSADLAKHIFTYFNGEIIDGGDVDNGIGLAFSSALPNDIICCCGSLYMMGVVRENVLNRK